MPPSTIVLLGYPVLSLLTAGAFAGLVAVAARRAGAGWAPVAWALVVQGAFAAGSLGLAASGVLARQDSLPPPFAILFVAIILGGVAFGRSSVGRLVADHLPTGALVLFQGFRLPLELLMHRTATEGVMPVQMSFSGSNFDVVTGALALLVGLGLLTGKLPRWSARVFEVVGLVLLVNILVIAVLSTPIFHVFGTSPTELNTFVFHPPYVLLPSVLVFHAIADHVALRRNLRRAHEAAALTTASREAPAAA